MPIGSEDGTSLASLAFNPTDATIYTIYNFDSYRSIDTFGTLSVSLGTAAQVGAGMSFSGAGELYGTDMTDMVQMNPATGATMSSSTLTGPVYSSFGGNMAWMAGQYYFADENTQSLVTISTTGTVTTVGTFAGTGYDVNGGQVLFSHLDQMYLLSGLNLLSVDITNGAVSKLGTVSGVAGDNPSPGFSGATSLSAPVPEVDPAGLGSVVALVAGALGLLERRRAMSVSTALR